MQAAVAMPISAPMPNSPPPDLGIYIGLVEAPLTATIINVTLGAIVTVLLLQLATRLSVKS